MIRKNNKRSLDTQMKSHVKRGAKKVIVKEEHIDPADLIPMGCTLLNLAMSGTIEGGALKGKMINIIGASHGGKTILALTSFAEANMKASFDDYSFVYDDVEHANSFDMNYLFGKSTAKRVIPPRLEKEDKFSITVQHFHANVIHHLKKKNPFIYVVDSFDALDALEDQKKVAQMVDDLENEKKDSAGSYGMAKAKAGSSILRGVTSGLDKSKSALFIISQIRDDVNPRSFSTKTRSGGHALKFYAHHEMWMTPTMPIKKLETVIGSTVKVNISKNKITGKRREIELDIYYDYGIDDIGSCITYLLKMKRWSGGGKVKINTNKDYKFAPCTRSKLIQLIEEEGSHKKLQRIVEIVWNNFEERLKLGRKRKYED